MFLTLLMQDFLCLWKYGVRALLYLQIHCKKGKSHIIAIHQGNPRDWFMKILHVNGLIFDLRFV